MSQLISEKIQAEVEATSPFFRFLQESTWAKRRTEKNISDLVTGNPHEMPLPAFVDVLQRAVTPEDKDWFAYKESTFQARSAVAASLVAQRGLAFTPEDIFLTNGSVAALSVALQTVLDPDDEVIFISPPWFFYQSLIRSFGAKPVRVKAQKNTFDLDLFAIEKALSSKTRAILINSPNNPSGRIYPPETLRALSRLLVEASNKNERPIYLISDEAYCRIVFSSHTYQSPTEFYPRSFLVYTYGKTLLTPGQRIGYLALPPGMPERVTLRSAIFIAQFLCGYAFPNNTLQYALPQLETLSIDMVHLEKKRDRLFSALMHMGYQVLSSEGTFYLLVCSPIKDDLAFCEQLAEEDVFVLPGSIMEIPAYFRISITASDTMIEKALAGFEKLAKQYNLNHSK